MISTTECERLVADLLKCDKRLKSLLNGGSNDLTEENKGWKVVCRKCSRDGVEGEARAFVCTAPQSIVLCTNRLSEKSIKQALMHEAVHAYDYSSGNVDFTSCEGLAYTELRAAKAAECSGFFPFRWMREDCIKQCAKKSTQCFFPMMGGSCVEKMFDIVMKEKDILEHHDEPTPQHISNNSVVSKRFNSSKNAQQ